jgi:uncharacterized transporter YbjL
LPLIVLVWVVLVWLQIVAANAGVGGRFFNGLLANFQFNQQHRPVNQKMNLFTMLAIYWTHIQTTQLASQKLPLLLAINCHCSQATDW